MPNPTARDRLIVALDMPTMEAARELVRTLDDTVSFYKVGLELLFAGGLEFAQDLRHMKKRVFLDMKLLDIGNTVERAVANAAELGLSFLTVHGADAKTLRAAVCGRGDKPLKLLRKTAATKLGQNPTYGRFAQYFLGHAPTTMADKHYVAPSQDQFDEAVAWLGTQILVSTPD